MTIITGILNESQKNYSLLSTMLNKLGKKLVKCDLKCDGINNNPKSGIIPRCLILEKRKGKRNCIVIGLNPGKCKKEQRDYYLSRNLKYEAIPEYFFKKISDLPYYKRTRNLMTTLGFDGDILWSDLVKCECKGKNGHIPVQTLRVCINKFLSEEIKIFSSSNIFALGNQAFDFCALSFPDHFIIGLPHPTGSYGNFIQFNKKVLKNPEYFKKVLCNQKDKYGNYKAVQLAKS